MFSNSALLNQYESLQTRLLRYYPGEHELQTAQYQINKEKKFVITRELRIHLNKSKNGITAQISTSARRAAGILSAGIKLAHSHQLLYVVTPLKLTRTERSSHANLLILDLRSKELMWFEPHGSDPTATGHPTAMLNYYEPEQIDHVLKRILGSLEERHLLRLLTPCDLKLSPVWGQSVTADSYCSFWCLLFFDYTIRGRRSEFIDRINMLTVQGRQELQRFIDVQLMDSTNLLRELMRHNSTAALPT